MSELKPCPWCGAQPFRMNANEEGEDPYYACPTFLCPGDQKCHNCGDQEGWMAEKWNTRATPPRAEVDVDQIAADVRAAFAEWTDDASDSMVSVIEDTDLVEWIEMNLRRALARATGGNDAT